MQPKFTLAMLAMLALLLIGTPSAKACGACGCTLNSDWASQGFSTRSGLHLDLRYDYFNQDQLRSGPRSVDRGSLALPNEQEIQQRTLNRNLTLTLDYSPSADWGVAIQVPTFDRTHASLIAGDTEPSFSQAKGLGDVRVLGRYQGFSEDHAFGLQAGVKLPTGGTGQTVNGGAQVGQMLDAGLQLGTGTTDLLLGCYGFGNLAENWDSFGQVLLQKPLGEKHGFKPGDGVNVNFGVRYGGFSRLTPHLQVNLRAEKRESGPNADVDNSGATLAYLSPGLTFRATPTLQLFAFAQVPLAQRVNGLQIEPRSSLSVGLRWTL